MSTKLLLWRAVMRKGLHGSGGNTAGVSDLRIQGCGTRIGWCWEWVWLAIWTGACGADQVEGGALGIAGEKALNAVGVLRP